jgi:Tfp pilus assembly protein PilW
MLMRDRPSLSDESGTTIIELLVGMAMGMIVLVGLTIVIITTMHGTARVDARVEATQNARLTVTKIIEDLHSACIAPQIAPVKEGSSETKLIFWHAASGEGHATTPAPVKSEISWGGGTLRQTDKAKTGMVNGEYVFEPVGTTQTLISNVSRPPGGAIFSYYNYANGTLSNTALPANPSLSKTNAEQTILVKVALVAEPASNPVQDRSADATVSDSATLRLTPPSFNESAAASPCQ